MTAYEVGDWKDFFLATSGATAALTGLIFVGLSINLARIVAIPGIPGRAAETLIQLGGALTAALLGLVPQSPPTFAMELLIVSGSVWGTTTYFHLAAWRRHQYDAPRHLATRVFFSQAGALPLLIAAISFAVGSGGGLYWMIPGLLCPIAASMMNAWVLLVEIVR